MNEASQVRAATGAGAAGAAAALPDINAETFPFEVVKALLNQAAYFHLLAAPAASGGAGIPAPEQPGRVIGVHLHAPLRRLVVDVAPPRRDGLHVSRRVGEVLATFEHRWLVVPHDFQARPGAEPPPTVLDPGRGQRFVMTDGVCRFGDGRDGFRGFGTGVTIPAVVGGRPTLLAGAVGTVIEGFGKLAGLRDGTYTCCGTLCPDAGFAGSVMLRIMDPGGALRGRGSLPPLVPVPDPEPGVTYVVLHGEKPAGASRTLYRYAPDGRVIGLQVHQQVTTFPLDAALGGRHGLTAAASVGRVIGKMTSDIDFNLFDPGAPGTAEAPIPFAAYNLFTFLDEAGEVVGSFGADGGEGRTFTMELAGAPGQRALRFGGFGPLKDGTGCFRGISGLMTDNSVVGLAPHVTSTLYVLRIDDPQGGYAAAMTGQPAPAPSAGSGHELIEEEFRPLLAKKDAFIPVYRRWRQGFAQCAEPIGRFLAETYNRLRHRGEFAGLEVDPEVMVAAFAGGVKPFDTVTFERYTGAAKADFHTYELATGKVLDSALLYSYWDPATHPVGQRQAKQIVGSHQRYFRPGALPPIEEQQVDLLVNSYHPEVGVTSWVSMHQHGLAERASIAYKLPHDHEVMWIVKDVSQDGQPIENDVFMASHEWKETRDGKEYFPMIGIFFRIDFARCAIEVFGDRFWRARYVAE